MSIVQIGNHADINKISIFVELCCFQPQSIEIPERSFLNCGLEFRISYILSTKNSIVMSIETNRPVEVINDSVNTNNPFSFKGRVRRTTYWITNIICNIICNIIVYVLGVTGENGFDDGALIIYLVLLIPICWVYAAVAAKRCHDLGHNGWWQLIPLYNLWLAFKKGQSGTNEYGPDPKGE